MIITDTDNIQKLLKSVTQSPSSTFQLRTLQYVTFMPFIFHKVTDPDIV